MKMFSKSVFAAAILATSLVSQVASAALPGSTGTLPVSTYTMPLQGDATGYTAHFGNSFLLDSTVNMTFTDRYTFSVGQNNLTTGSLTAKPLRTQDLYVSSFDVYTSAGVLVVSGVNTNANSQNPGQIDKWELPDTVVLSGGSYYFEVTGQVLGKNSSYGAEMSLSPVPEAETYAMMLAGLGMVGFVARRRAAKKAA